MEFVRETLSTNSGSSAPLAVIIATDGEEAALFPTLSTLVEGAIEGLIGTVVIAEAQRRPQIERIAEESGCAFIGGKPDLGERLAAGVAAVRARWLLFMRPGSALAEGWTREVGAFMGRPRPTEEMAATFPLRFSGSGIRLRLVEAAAAARWTVMRSPLPQQGLLMARALYDAIGGHRPGPNSDRDLARRLRRVTRLSIPMLQPPFD